MNCLQKTKVLTLNKSIINNNNNKKIKKKNNNNNSNNNQICIAQACRMTSEALDGQLQSCHTARCLTEEKCF